MSDALLSLGLIQPRSVIPIGRLAVRSLHTELLLSPKPGLVSPLDSGSHSDMDAGTFMRSMFALRSYFMDIADAGASGAEFEALRRLGIAAEERMLRATGGVNTHRGAIFSLGLLAAAAAWLIQRGRCPRNENIGRTVSRLWSAGIVAASPPPQQIDSHGLAARRNYGVGGARQEAVLGFPTIWSVGLPALREVLGRTGNKRMALIQTLFSLMASLDDTNVLHRGGRSGLSLVRTSAQKFLRAGGVYRRNWETHALKIHCEVTRQGLSPGGSADLLAASWFVHQIQKTYSWA